MVSEDEESRKNPLHFGTVPETVVQNFNLGLSILNGGA